MHEKIGLTHTDLKPENILLKMDTRKWCKDPAFHPINVQNKSAMYDGERVEETESDSDDQSKAPLQQQPDERIHDGGTGGNTHQVAENQPSDLATQNQQEGMIDQEPI